MGSSNSNDLEDNILELLDWTDAESTSGIWLTRSLSQCLTDTKSRSNSKTDAKSRSMSVSAVVRCRGGLR